MPATPPAERLAYLDGLRGVAILSVLGFHYFTCFQDLYPYGAAWADVPLFRWGHWGVQLFFAISGFVILMTLERCAGPGDFALRRFARLWPTMALCAALSYLTLSVVPSPWSPRPADFLPSLTFIDPAVWNKLLPGLESRWIDVAYWSLFVEVRFYALAALLYFAAPRRFTPLFYGGSTVIVGAYVALQGLGHGTQAEWLQWLFAAKFLPWFVLGIAARAAAQNRQGVALRGVGLATLQVGALSWHAGAAVSAQPMALLLVVVLMLGPLRWPRLAGWLSVRPLVDLGASSYCLYLLHQYAGLALLGMLARTWGLQGTAALPLAIAIAVGMVGVSRTIHRHWEDPIHARCVRLFHSRGPHRVARTQACEAASR